MTNQTPKAKHGIWTPWAQVICVDCHGNNFPRGPLSDKELLEYQTPTELEEYCGITQCGGCGTDIQLANEVAEEHNIVLRLKDLGFDAQMEQTGGMCSAASVYIETGKTYDPERGLQNPWIYITYDLDGNGAYSASAFDEQGEWLEGSLDVQVDTWDEMLEALKQQPLMKLKVKETKRYTNYSEENDITFIMEDYLVDNELISTEVKGFYYGEPNDTATETFYGKVKASFVSEDENNG